MRQSKLIDKIMARTAASVTRAEVREYLNDVQNFILGRPTPVSRVQPDPILRTTEDVLRYTANTSIVDDNGDPVGDICLVRRVYRTGLDVSLYSPDERVFQGDQGNEVDIGVGCVRSIEPGADDCQIVWPARTPPKTTTDQWRCEVYIWPAQLDSEQIPLSVPADGQLSLLMMGVLEQVETQEYGRGDWPSAKFMQAMEDFDNRHSTDVFQPGVQTNNQIPYRSC